MLGIKDTYKVFRKTEYLQNIFNPVLIFGPDVDLAFVF